MSTEPLPRPEVSALSVTGEASGPDTASVTVADTVAPAWFRVNVGGVSHSTPGSDRSIESSSSPVAQLLAGSHDSSDTYVCVPSLFAFVFGGSVGVPELGSGSTDVQSIVTGASYHPWAFAARSGEPVTVGGAESAGPRSRMKMSVTLPLVSLATRLDDAEWNAT